MAPSHGKMLTSQGHLLIYKREESTGDFIVMKFDTELTYDTSLVNQEELSRLLATCSPVGNAIPESTARLTGKVWLKYQYILKAFK
jgi:hypothetical protein